MTPLNTVIGTRELCAWQPCTRITWVQTRSPEFARKLHQRADGRLVAWGVAGGFLRTYEFPHSLGWARDLIARYTSNELATNGRKIVLAAPVEHFDSKVVPEPTAPVT
jgi:hypothetical protein